MGQNGWVLGLDCWRTSPEWLGARPGKLGARPGYGEQVQNGWGLGLAQNNIPTVLTLFTMGNILLSKVIQKSEVFNLRCINVRQYFKLENYQALLW